MKRIILVLLTITLMLLVSCAFADGGEAGEDLLTWTLQDGVLTISGQGPMMDYSDNTPAPWEMRKDTITTVVIQRGVTSVGNFAFRFYDHLTSVTFPRGLEAIGDYAFQGCNYLENITIPSTVVSLGTSAFEGCPITRLTLPSGLTQIPEYAFHSSHISTVTIPDNVETIGFGAFSYSWLQTIYLPESVTVIIQNAFDNCNNLTEVHYDGTMAQANAIRIGSSNGPIANAKWICSDGDLDDGIGNNSGTCGEDLEWSFQDGVLTITGQGPMTNYSYSNSAPWEMKKEKITAIVIEEGATSVGSYAFRDYNHLTSVTLPEGLETIGDYAFQSCYYLESMTIPSTVVSLGTSAFENCPITELTLPEGLTRIPEYAFISSHISTVTIPDGVEVIGFGAFSYSWLQTIYLPVNVTEIIQNAFDNCNNLTEVHYDGTKAQANAIRIGSSNGPIANAKWICSDGEMEGIGGSGGTCGEDLEWNLQNGVLTITGQGPMTNYSDGHSAPWEMKKEKITAIVIEEGATSVGSYAFRFYDHLTSVTFPEGLETIGDYAFQGCNYLENITIPSTVVSLGTSAFEGCPITELTLPEGLTQIPEYAFHSSHISTVTIPDGVETIGFGAFSYSWLQTIYLPVSVTGIIQNAFDNCNSLAEVHYDGTTAQANAIRVGSSNGPIANAKWICSDGDLDDGIGATEGNCGSNVIWNLSGDTLVITGHGDMATFTAEYPVPWTAYREDITSLQIGEGVTTISDGAFRGMTRLTQMTLPKSLESIGENATADCSALTEVDFAGSEEMAKLMPLGDGNEWLVQAHWHYRMDNEGNLDGAVYWRLEGATLRIYGSGRMPDYDTGFAVPWHASVGRITSVIIEDGVTNIGNYLFYGCTALESIEIAPTVTGIGNYAFSGCTALAEITVPQKVTKIGFYAFENCSSLSSVALPQGRVSIGEYAFYKCRALTGITLPAGMTQISYGMLQNTGLTSITIPEKVKTIHEGAFYGCTALTQAGLPAGIDTIEMNAFYNTAVATVVYGGELADAACIDLGTGNDRLPAASWQCSDMTGAYPLARSGMLTTGLTWTLAEGTLTISGSGAIPDYTEQNGAPWYYLRDEITAIVLDEGVRSAGEWAFHRMANVTAVTLPEGLEAIREYAFCRCSSLQTATLPATLLYVADTAFSNCPAGNSLNWDFDNLYDQDPDYGSTPDTNSVTWSLEDGILTISGRGTMEDGSRPWYSRRESIAAIVIQDGITGIWEGAFRNCVNAVSVCIPDSVSFIRIGAFSGCTGLESVDFGGTEEAARKLAIGLNNKPLINAAWNWTGYTGSYPADSEGILSPDFEWRLDFNGTLVVTGEGAMPDCNDSFHAPWNKYASRIRNLIIEDDVKTIGAYTFTDFSNLTRVTIPDSVTSIGEGAFCNNRKLATLTIPASVAVIGPEAFRNSGLTEITIPDTVVRIGYYAFYNCTKLATLNLGTGLKELPYGLCGSCYALESITIPDNVKLIAFDAFRFCRNLAEVSLPGGLEVIGSDAFNDCPRLESVMFRGTEAQAAAIRIGTGNEQLTDAAWTIPDRTGTDYPVTIGGQLTETMTWQVSGDTLTISGSGEMPSYTYENPAPWLNLSNRIRKISIGSGVTQIGSYAFCRLTKTTEVTIPDTVVRIGAYAFANTTSLTVITIPESIRSIGNWAFQQSGLTAVSIPDSVITMEWFAFSNCNALTQVTLGTGLRELDFGVFWGCQKLPEITIPDGVTIIGEDAFGACYKLASISLPDSMTTIETGAFRSTILTNVTFRGTPAKASTIAIGSNNGNLTGATWHFIDNSTGSYPAATGGALTNTIQWNAENGVLTITGRGAMPSFSEKSSVPWQGHSANIRKVVIGSGIRSVGAYAFRDMAALEEAELAGSVTGIGAYAFYGTTQLKGIDLPEGLTVIGEYAFGNSGLESIELPDSVTSLGDWAFTQCYSLTEVKLSAGLTRIPGYAFWCDTALKSIVIPEGVAAIGTNAFYSCDNLTYIDLPASMSLIEYNAFFNCNRLAKVRYRDTEDAAFYLEIDSGNAPLMDADWRYKILNPIDGLEHVLRLPKGVKRIEDSAFEGTGAQAAVIPEGTEAIGEYAFANSTALQYVQIPETVGSIAGNAFDNSNVTIVCEEGGTIDAWAQEHRIEVMWTE